MADYVAKYANKDAADEAGEDEDEEDEMSSAGSFTDDLSNMSRYQGCQRATVIFFRCETRPYHCPARLVVVVGVGLI